MIPQISITDFGFDDRSSCFGLPTGEHTDHSTIGLPLPNTRDRDSGVSSDNSAYSTEMSTPAGIDFSRRSSAYSIGYECSTINRNMPNVPYYRQISFDNAYEKSDSTSTDGPTVSKSKSWQDIKDNKAGRERRHKAIFSSDANIGRERCQQKRKRRKFIPGRRKSVATRSKAI